MIKISFLNFDIVLKWFTNVDNLTDLFFKEEHLPLLHSSFLQYEVAFNRELLLPTILAEAVQSFLFNCRRYKRYKYIIVL